MRIRLALAVLLSACSANDDVPAPVLASVTPDHAGVGASVMLAGSFLCQQPEGSGDEVDPLACAHTGSVMFGVEPAIVTQYTDSSATAQVPDMPAGSVEIGIATGGRTTNTIDFTID